VASVTQCKESDLKKKIADTNDWAIIEKQLVAWGEFYRVGKKITLQLLFNYVDVTPSSTTLLGRPAKRGFLSTT
jgi:hypothetical protein